MTRAYTSAVRGDGTVDDRALVFSVRDHRDVRPAVARYLDDHIAEGGIACVLDHVTKAERTDGKASVKPLFPERAAELLRGPNWCLGVPDVDSVKGELSRLHYVRFGSAEQCAQVERLLAADTKIGNVHRPSILYPLNSLTLPPSEEIAHQWGLLKCGFHQIWEDLDNGQGEDPGPIAVIDNGVVQHTDLTGRVVSVGTTRGPRSRSNHAVGVAGVIAAHRGNNDRKGMAGCCSATIKVYSVWTDVGFDSEAYYSALRDVIDSGLRVVNVSMGTPQPDPTSELLISECIRNGTIVVAAMGNLVDMGSPPMFPAATPGVIAVGATDQFDRKARESSLGHHIWISAPGVDIVTSFGKDEYVRQKGNSFAAPMVSAAVWLVLWKQPGFHAEDVRELLAKSAVLRNGEHFAGVGHGRLDMPKLAQALRQL